MFILTQQQVCLGDSNRQLFLSLEIYNYYNEMLLCNAAIRAEQHNSSFQSCLKFLTGFYSTVDLTTQLKIIFDA